MSQLIDMARNGQEIDQDICTTAEEEWDEVDQGDSGETPAHGQSRQERVATKERE